MRRRPPPRPRPETLALARRATARPASYASLCTELSVEDELIFTRAIATQLLAMLQKREPLLANAYLDRLDVAARATIDRTFEAILVLLFRHHIEVAPVRRMLWAYDAQPDQFIVTYQNQTDEIVDRERLLSMAGLAA